ncbi:MAG: iron-containing redox enzyme family protein [Planctomycetales bacterium]
MNDRPRVSLNTPMRELFVKLGMLSVGDTPPPHFSLFFSQADRIMDRVLDLWEHGEETWDRAAAFQQLLADVGARVMCHPIIAGNRYLRRFAEGVTVAQARHEVQQFSVFGLQFDVAQAKLVANAPTRESYRERLNVLLNEKGIPYQDGFDGDLTGRWNPATVHFQWMQNTAAGLGLHFEDVGKIWIGLPGTVQFVETTFETYANTDQNIAAGASFAVENWAANSLWTPWIAGMKKLNATLDEPIDLGYLTYHEAEEIHHSQATLDELWENFSEPFFDAEKFFDGAETLLTRGIQVYYESQLESLPDKDASWPDRACDPPLLDPSAVGRLLIEPSMN